MGFTFLLHKTTKVGSMGWFSRTPSPPPFGGRPFAGQGRRPPPSGLIDVRSAGEYAGGPHRRRPQPAAVDRLSQDSRAQRAGPAPRRCCCTASPEMRSRHGLPGAAADGLHAGPQRRRRGRAVAAAWPADPALGLSLSPGQARRRRAVDLYRTLAMNAAAGSCRTATGSPGSSRSAAPASPRAGPRSRPPSATTRSSPGCGPGPPAPARWRCRSGPSACP